MGWIRAREVNLQADRRKIVNRCVIGFKKQRRVCRRLNISNEISSTNDVLTEGGSAFQLRRLELLKSERFMQL